MLQLIRKACYFRHSLVILPFSSNTSITSLHPATLIRHRIPPSLTIRSPDSPITIPFHPTRPHPYYPAHPLSSLQSEDHASRMTRPSHRRYLT
ncbi:uncharacterized protein LAESUDRAFT_732202, partial [Laetiporus sulphureus 93-53]